jgi:membrane protease YdiL (CAAX protease family)
MFQDLLFGSLICLYLGAFLGSLYHWVRYLTKPKGKLGIPSQRTWLISITQNDSPCSTSPQNHALIPVSPPSCLMIVIFVTSMLIKIVQVTFSGEEVTIKQENISTQTISFLSMWGFLLVLHFIWIDQSFNWLRNYQVINKYLQVHNFEELMKYLTRAYSLFCFSFLPIYFLMISTFIFRDQSKLNPLLKVINQQTDLHTMFWLYASAVIAAPLAEELMFRFCLQGLLTRVIKPVFAVVVTALIFSAVHGWPDALPLIPLALILGFHMHYTGEYLTVVLTHALFNGFMLTNFIILTHLDI